MNEKFRNLIQQSGLPMWTTEGNHKVQVASKMDWLMTSIVEECCNVLERTQNGNGVQEIKEHFNLKDLDNNK